MPEQNEIKATVESPEVHAHLGLLQGVINRIAGNSALCKTLCVTMVAAVAAIAASAGSAAALWVAVFPLAACAVLDAAYLSQEKGFRATYNRTVEKLHNGELTQTQLFIIEPEKGYAKPRKLLEAAGSWSVWGLYGAFALLLLIIGLIV